MDNAEILSLQFHEHLKATSKLALVTLSKYKTAMNRFLGFLQSQNYDLLALTSKDLDFFLSKLCVQGYSPSAIQECSIVLKKFFLYLHDFYGYNNIAYDIQPPIRPETVTLRHDDIKKVIRRAADHTKTNLRDSLILYLYFICKTPPKSIINLLQKNTDSLRGALLDEQRGITILLPQPWSDRLRAFMYRRDKTQRFLFYGNNGYETFALTVQAVIRIINQALENSLDPHYQRKTALYFKSDKMQTMQSMPESQSQINFLKKLYGAKHPRS